MNITMKVNSDGKKYEISFPGLQEDKFDLVGNAILGQLNLHFYDVKEPNSNEEFFNDNDSPSFIGKVVQEKLSIEICLDEPSLAPGLTEKEAKELKSEYKTSAIPLFGALRRYIGKQYIDCNSVLSIGFQSPYETSHKKHVSQVSLFKQSDNHEYDQAPLIDGIPDCRPF